MVIIFMSNIQSVPEIQKIVNVFSQNIGNNLFALISVGSLTTKHYLESWSDIDLIVVFDQISFSDKNTISKIKSRLENTYKKRFGINIITRQEATSPILPVISIDGKTLQGLLDLNTHPERLLFCRESGVVFFVPDSQTIKEYSISNIFMFLRRNRKSLTSDLSSVDVPLKNVTEREIRASFIMTRLAIQYIKGINCSGYKEISETAKELFPHHDSSILSSLEKAIRRWNTIEKQSEIRNLLRNADSYIESLAKYILSVI